MSCIPMRTCLVVDLKNRLDHLKREVESAMSNIRSIMSRGNSIFAVQKSIQIAEDFLKNFPSTHAELGLLIDNIVKLNCDLRIILAKKSDNLNTNGFEDNDSLLFEGDPWNRQSVSSCSVCSKEKKTIGVCTEIMPLSDTIEYEFTETSRLYNLEKESILEMKYLSGESPSEFWLGFYSDNELQSHLLAVKNKIHTGELHRLSATPRIGQFIIGCVDTVFRGCVLSISEKSIFAVDIDRGDLKSVNKHNSWDVGDCLSQFPPQAVRCKLSSMKPDVEWYNCLSNMFRNCLKGCNLVVIVKDIIPDTIPIFIVDVNSHDNITLNINLNEWINSYVFPAIEKVKLHELSDIVDETVFQDINPFIICKEDRTSNSAYSSGNESCCEEEGKNLVDNSLTSQIIDERTAMFNSVEINEEETSTEGAGELVSSSTFVDMEDIKMSKISGSCFMSVKSSEKKLDSNKVNAYSFEDLGEPTCQEKFSEITTEMQSLQLEPQMEFTSVKCRMDIGTTTEMLFLHGNDPWNFTLHYIPKEEYAQLKNVIKNKVERNEIKRFQNDPKVGNFAIGKHDLDYCRVYITDISQSSGEVVVIDVDDGEIKLLSLNDLWQLDQSFSLLPAMAVCCSLWNILRHPLYWNVDLENLFIKLMSKGPLKVCIKDIEFDSGYWKHIVQIQTLHECVFDVSEWIMFHVFPSLQEMQQSSGESISDFVSKVDPFELFNENSVSCVTSPQCVNDRNTVVRKINNKAFSDDTSGWTDFKLKSDKFRKNGQESSKNNDCFERACGNYKNKETYSKFCSKIQQSSLYKKCKINVTPGSKYFAFLSGILSPSEFYVQIVSAENSLIDERQEELQNYFSEGSICFRSKKEARQLILNCCAVNFENRWCRGIVVSWLEESSDEVFVFLVDYGIYSAVPFDTIQCLRSDFYKYPPFAQRCSLACISPPNGSSVWPRESLEGFWKILDYEAVYEICIESYLETDDTLNVFLLYELQDFDCINDYLINRHFAVNNSGLMITKPENCHSVVCPVVDTAENLSDDEEWNDGNNAQSLEVLTYFDNNTVGLPKIGEQLQIVITEIVNLHSFYGVQTDVQFGGKKCKTHDILLDINKKITSAAESGQLKPSKFLIEGAIVVARFNTDKIWYRARILMSPDDFDYVDVYFVDYGNVDRVHKQYIKEISKEFCSFPFQAMRFFFEGIDMTKLTQKYARMKALAMLNELVGKKSVLIKVVSEINEDIMIRVFKDGIDIADMLLKVYHEQCRVQDSKNINSK